MFCAAHLDSPATMAFVPVEVFIAEDLAEYSWVYSCFPRHLYRRYLIDLLRYMGPTTRGAVPHFSRRSIPRGWLSRASKRRTYLDRYPHGVSRGIAGAVEILPLL
jgi:hypothetical protein